MNPKRFKHRSTQDVLATFVHEMTHLEQTAFGKPTRTGYHNRAWGALMKRVGLYPSSTGEPSGKETGQRVHHYIIAGGPFSIACAALLKTGLTIEYADIWKEREGRGAE
jgi:predicted SprT family Zn-dependent metalloprotease